MRRLLIEPPMCMADAAAWVTPAELADADAFGSERRKEEFLTWRAIVRRELGADVSISYNAVGAPVVDWDVHISVAHCRGRVAVCFSEQPCAVDIEPEDRDFGAAAARCMTGDELALSADPRLAAALWCSKETLYKYAGEQGLDLLRDLRIEQADLAAGYLRGRIKNGEPVGLSVSFDDGYVVVYIL